MQMASITDEKEKAVIKKSIASLMAKYDFNSLGGAILLGVNKIIIKAHGSANSDTIYNTIKQGYELALKNVIEVLKKEL